MSSENYFRTIRAFRGGEVSSDERARSRRKILHSNRACGLEVTLDREGFDSTLPGMVTGGRDCRTKSPRSDLFS